MTKENQTTGDLNLIRENMEVESSDGVRIGTIDHVDSEYLKLKAKDSPTHEHRFIPVASVSQVSGNIVHLNLDEFQLREELTSQQNQGMDVNQRTDQPGRMAS